MPPETISDTPFSQDDSGDFVIDESVPSQGDISIDEATGSVGGDLLQASTLGDLPTVFKQARDNPNKKGGLLNWRVLADRSPDAASTFDKHSKQVNQDFFTEMGNIKKETGKDASLLQQLWGTAKAMGRQFGVGMQYAAGLDEKDIEAMSNAQVARQYIGDLKDDFDIRLALSRGSQYRKDLEEGKQIAKPDGDLAELGFPEGGLPSIGMTIGRAQEYLNDLRDDRTKAIGTAGLRNFAVKTGDAFIPFVDVGNIIIDEKDPEQVAKRAALTEQINAVVAKDYLKSTLTGSVLGSLAQFALGTGLTTKAFGAVTKAGVAAEDVALFGQETATAIAEAAQAGKTATPLSKAVSYGTIGASQSLKGDRRDLTWYERLMDIGTEAVTLYGAETIGNTVERRLEDQFAKYIAKQSAVKNAPIVGAIAKTGLGAGAMTIGEFTSEEVEAVLRGQDPVANAAQTLMASAGAGFGTRGMSFRNQYASLQQRVNLYRSIQFREQLSAIFSDPGISDQDKLERVQTLRANVDGNTQPLFDLVSEGLTASIALKKLNKETSPQSYSVVQEQVEEAGKKVDEEATRLADQLAGEAEQKMTQPEQPAETVAPDIKNTEVETLEKKLSEAQGEELVFNTFQIDYDLNDPATGDTMKSTLLELMGDSEKKLRFKPGADTDKLVAWATGRSDIYGELDPETGDYVIRGIETGPEDAPIWRGDADPAEVFPQDKYAVYQRLKATGKFTREELDDIENELELITKLEEIDTYESKKMSEITEDQKKEEEVSGEFNTTVEAQVNPQIRKDLQEADDLEAQAKESVPEKAQELRDQAKALRSRASNAKRKVEEEGVRIAEGRLAKKKADIEERASQNKVPLSDTLTHPANNPDGVEMTYLKENPVPSERETDKNLLGEVFDLTNESTVKMLKAMGALDENTGEPLMNAVDVIEDYLESKRSVFERSKEYQSLKQFDFFDELKSATKNTLLYNIRRGKTPVYLSKTLDFTEGDLLEKVWPRVMQRGGTAVQIQEELVSGETPMGEEPIKETETAGPQGEAVAVADQVDRNLSNQKLDTDLAESKKLLLDEFRQKFRASLPTDFDRAIFDTTLAGGNVRSIKDVAKEIGRAEQTVVRRGRELYAKFSPAFREEFDKRQREGKLPQISRVQLTATPEGGAVAQISVKSQAEVKANLTDAQKITDPQVKEIVRQIEEAYKLQYITIDQYKTLLNAKPDGKGGIVGITVSRDADNAIMIKQFLNASVLAEISSIADPMNLINDVEEELARLSEDLSEKDIAGFRKEIQTAVEKYNQNEGVTDPNQKNRVLKDFRDSMVNLSSKITEKAGYENKDEATAKTEIDRTAEANSRTRTAGVQRPTSSGSKATTTKSATQPVAVTRPVQQGPAVQPGGTAKTGQLPSVKPGGEPVTAPVRTRKKGTPIDKKFVFTRGQRTSQRDPGIVKEISQKIKGLLKPEQLYDLVSGLSQVKNTIQRAFYWMNGPGTGKTYVLAGAAKYHMEQPNKKWKVAYISTTQALGMDPNSSWDTRTFGGTLAKAVLPENFDIPTSLRGSKGKRGKGLTIDASALSPDHMLVTTYRYLSDLLPFIDENTLLIFDEHQTVRNVHKAIQEGGSKEATSALAASMKAGRVLFASGSPVENADQLYSFQRLGIFDRLPGNTIDQKRAALMDALGQQKVYRAGGSKYTWELKEELTQDQADDLLDGVVAQLSQDGYLSSRSISLEGVKFSRVDVPLSKEAKDRIRFIEAAHRAGSMTPGQFSQMMLEMRRAIEEFKVAQGLKRAADDIDRGRKVVFVINSVNDTDIKNAVTDQPILAIKATADIVRNQLKAINEERVKNGKAPIKFAEYHGSSKENATALDSFNLQDAQLLITTSYKGGVGVEMDDKAGDQPRSIYILTAPLSAIDTVQQIFRVWRLDTASAVEGGILIADTEADQWALERFARRLRNLETLMGAGFGVLNVNAEPILTQKLPGSTITEPAPAVEQKPAPADQAEQKTETVPAPVEAPVQTEQKAEAATKDESSAVTPLVSEDQAAQQTEEILNASKTKLDVVTKPVVETLVESGLVVEGVTPNAVMIRFDTSAPDTDARATLLEQRIKDSGFQIVAWSPGQVTIAKTSGDFTGSDAAVLSRIFTGDEQPVTATTTAADENERLKRVLASDKDQKRITDLLKRLFPKLKTTVEVDFASGHAFLAVAGDANGEDKVVINPSEIANEIEALGLKTAEGIQEYLILAVVEEAIHIKSFEILRSYGQNPGLEADRLGAVMPKALKINSATIYYAAKGLVSSDPSVNKLVTMMANDNMLSALEYIRRQVQLKVLGTITEEGLLKGKEGDALRNAKRRLSNLMLNEQTVNLTSGKDGAGVREAILRWLKALIDAIGLIKKEINLSNLGDVESSVDSSLDFVMGQLKSLADELTPQEQVFNGVSPNQGRPIGATDKTDLRVHRQIDMYLTFGNTNSIFGVRAANDAGRSVDADAWLTALDMAKGMKIITEVEHTIYKAATDMAGIDRNRVSLTDINSNAIKVWEAKEASGERLPTEIFVTAQDMPSNKEGSENDPIEGITQKLINSQDTNLKDHLNEKIAELARTAGPNENVESDSWRSGALIRTLNDIESLGETNGGAFTDFSSPQFNEWKSIHDKAVALRDKLLGKEKVAEGTQDETVPVSLKTPESLFASIANAKDFRAITDSLSKIPVNELVSSLLRMGIATAEDFALQRFEDFGGNEFKNIPEYAKRNFINGKIYSAFKASPQNTTLNGEVTFESQDAFDQEMSNQTSPVPFIEYTRRIPVPDLIENLLRVGVIGPKFLEDFVPVTSLNTEMKFKDVSDTDKRFFLEKSIKQKFNNLMGAKRLQAGAPRATGGFFVSELDNAAYLGAVQNNDLAKAAKVFENVAIQFARSYPETGYALTPSIYLGYRADGSKLKNYAEVDYKTEITVVVKFSNGKVIVDGMNGLNFQHALERARRNWSDALVLPSAITPADPVLYDERRDVIPLTARFKPDYRIHATTARQRALQLRPAFKFALTLPNNGVVYSTARSEAKGLVNTLVNLFKQNGGKPVLFEGKTYKADEWRSLYYAVKSSPSYTGYLNKVSQLNAPAPGTGPTIRYSQAVNNLANLTNDGALSEYIRANSSYKEQSNQELYDKAKQFVKDNGVTTSFELLRSDSLSLPGSLETAIAMQVVSELQANAEEAAKINPDDTSDSERIADLAIFLMKKYASETGRSLNYMKFFDKVVANPVSLQLMVDKILSKAVDYKVKPFLPELKDIQTSLDKSAVRSAEQLTELPGVEKLLKTIGVVAPRVQGSPRVSQLIAAINKANRNTTVVEALNRFKKRIGASAPGGRPDSEIPIDKDAINDLADALYAHILEVNEIDPETVDQIFEDRAVLNDYLAKMGLNANQIHLYGAAAAVIVRQRIETVASGAAETPIQTSKTVEQAEEDLDKVISKTRAKTRVKIDPNQNPMEAMGIAIADALQKQAERLKQEPEKEAFLKYFKREVQKAIAGRIKEKGGLQPVYEPIAPPSAAEKIRDRVAKYTDVELVLNTVRATLISNYTEEQLEGLEPLIDDALDRLFTLSELKSALGKLNTIGGMSVNIKSLIRQSNGDVAKFSGQLRDLLLRDTTLSEVKRNEVTRFLSEGLRSLVREERKKELANIKKRFEQRAERKTRAIRGVLDRLMEATNLGALRDEEVFQYIRESIGLPDVTPEVRKEIEAKVKKVSKMPEGSIRMRGLNDLFGFIKTSAPIAWGDMIVDLQTFNLLASISTLGVNTWGSTLQVSTDIFLMSAMNSIEGLFKKTGTGGGWRGFGRLLQVGLPKWLGGTGEAWTALNIVRKGDLSAAADMTAANSFSTVNTFQALKKKFENAKKGRLPIEDAYQEISLPLGQSLSISLNPTTATGNVINAALTPAVWVSQGMAMGDAWNKMGAKKAMEIAEAYRIATTRFTEQDEVDAEVMRLLNYTPEARQKAIAQAEVEAKTFGLNASQQVARVEEIMEQGRDEDGQRITELSTEYAKRATFTNDFEGSLGKLMAGMQRLAQNGHWSLRTIFKFLKTASSLTNEALNWLPAWSLKRLLVGAGTFTEAGSKYRRGAAQPGTNAFNIQLAKVILGHMMTMGFLAILRAFGAWGPDRDEDPAFMIHYEGPDDQAQSKAWRAAGAKGRSIQIGRFRDGNPRFISWESLPFGLSGVLLPVGIFVEAQRYSKRSEAEATMMAVGAALPAVAAGIVDLAFMNGLRRVFNAVYPKQPGAAGRVQEVADFVGNLAGTIVVPAYATLRDLETTIDAFRQSSAGRPAKLGVTGAFVRSIPFASSVPEVVEAVSPESGKMISKVIRPDLSMLGTPVKIPLLRGIPIAKRFFSLGADINSEDPETRIFALLAAKQIGILWSPSELSGIAVREAQLKFAAGQFSPEQYQRELSNAAFLGKRLTGEEKYDWMEAAGPELVKVLSNPQIFNLILNTQDPNVAREIVSRVTRPIKRQALIESQIKYLKNKELELIEE